MDNKTAVYDPYWARKGERERERKKMMEHAVKNLSNGSPPPSHCGGDQRQLLVECGIWR